MALWREVADGARRLLMLDDQVTRNTADSKQLQRDMTDLTAALQRLAYEVRSMGENERHEREKMALRLENALLRFERRLPPPGKAEEGEK